MRPCSISDLEDFHHEPPQVPAIKQDSPKLRLIAIPHKLIFSDVESMGCMFKQNIAKQLKQSYQIITKKSDLQRSTLKARNMKKICI